MSLTNIIHQRPSSKDAEMFVIGTILKYSESYVSISSMLCEDSFYDPKLAQIYRYIKQAARDGETPDMLAVGKRIMMNHQTDDANEMMYEMTMCCDTTHDETSLSQSVRVLEHFRQQRLYLELGEWLTFSASKRTPEELAAKMLEYQSKLVSSEGSKAMDKHDINDEILKIVDANNRQNAPTQRTWTNFRIFDEEGGFLPGKLIIVAAQTSQGKSSIALTFAFNAMKQGQSVAIYSMEMDHKSIGVRMLNMAGLRMKESNVLYDGLLQPGAVYDAANLIESFPGNYYVDDKSNTSIDKIIESIRFMKQKHNIVGAVVDYIQILNVYSKGRRSQEQILADAARLLQAEAKASNIWILILSQISRNTDPGQTHDPSSDKLRGSGQILEAADMSILLYRPEVYKEQYPGEFADVDTHNTALLKLTKCRGGASQKAEIVHFYPEMTYFEAFKEGERIPRNYFVNQTPQGKSNTPF